MFTVSKGQVLGIKGPLGDTTQESILRQVVPEDPPQCATPPPVTVAAHRPLLGEAGALKPKKVTVPTEVQYHLGVSSTVLYAAPLSLGLLYSVRTSSLCHTIKCGRIVSDTFPSGK
jgi:hypothetical protein